MTMTIATIQHNALIVRSEEVSANIVVISLSGQMSGNLNTVCNMQSVRCAYIAGVMSDERPVYHVENSPL